MARNPFALLGDEDDGSGVNAIMERFEADKAAEEKMKAAAGKLNRKAEQKPPSRSFENVSGRGRGGGGNGRFGGGRGGQGPGEFRNWRQSYTNSTGNQGRNGNGLGDGTGIGEKGYNFNQNRQVRYETWRAGEENKDSKGDDNGGRGRGGFRGVKNRGSWGGGNGRGSEGRNQLENNNKEVAAVGDVEGRASDNDNNSNNGHASSRSR